MPEERGWPPLDDPFLLSWLRMPDSELAGALADLFARQEPVAWTEEAIAEQVERAHGYPWERPAQPVILRGTELRADRELDDGVRRFPLLAFGSNGWPTRLAAKFTGLPVQDVRIVPATLHDHDVAALSIPTSYGSFAGGIVRSPGTAVRVVLLEVTARQFERLTVTEFSYHVGRLGGIRLEGDDGRTRTGTYVYLQRLGLLPWDGGAPVALEAVAAENRRFESAGQRQLLDCCAERTLGPGATGDDVIRALLLTYPEFAGRHFPGLIDAALHPPLQGFRRHPASL